MKNKSLIYNCWSDADPLDSFDVEADSYVKALEAIIFELGYCVGEGHEPEDDELELEKEETGKKLKKNLDI